jgi:DNA-nicking Smr family endonuclease
MNELDKIVFVDSLPKLDLHGYDRESARVTINDFINENYKLKNKIFVIIHGRGYGNSVLKLTTAKVLKNNRLVNDYKTYYYNDGCTIVLLND